MEVLLTLFYAFFALTFVVVIHELGHLLIARATGIKVEVFSIFFGRPILLFKWRGIKWQFGWLPFGGYCKMKGQDDFAKIEVKGDADEFYSRPPWARFLTILGGPLFNIILGFTIFISLTYWNGEVIYPNSPIVVDPLYSDQMELKSNDVITSIDGKPMRSWNDISTAMLLGLHKNERDMVVQRQGVEVPIKYQFDKEKQVKKDFGFTFPKLLIMQSVLERVPFELLPSGEHIEKDNPNAKANIKPRDILISINKKPIQTRSELHYYLNQKQNSPKKDTVLLLEGLPKHTKLRSFDGIIFSSINKLVKHLEHDPDKEEYVATFIQPNGIELDGVLKRKYVQLEPLEKQRFNPDTKEMDISYQYGILLMAQGMPASDAEVYHHYYSLLESIAHGVNKGVDVFILSMTQFKLLTQLSTDTLRQNVSGPIGILKNLGEVGNKDFISYLTMIGLISIFLAVFNLLPIPAVDGWHLWLTVIEMIRRKPISLKIIQRFQWVGLIIILLLAILITFNDILKFF